MATEGENKTTGTQPVPASSSKKAASSDLAEEIGTLTYPRAVQHFGKDRAIEVMQHVANLGGHGLFEEAELKAPLFGGLAMPSPETLLKPRKEDYAHLPEADFHFQAALETHETLKEQAVQNRTKINEYYTGLK